MEITKWQKDNIAKVNAEIDKYSPGEIVMVRNDLIAGKLYNRRVFTDWMEKFKGYETVVTRVTPLPDGTIMYQLHADGGVYGWSKEMLLPVNYRLPRDSNIRNPLSSAPGYRAPVDYDYIDEKIKGEPSFLEKMWRRLPRLG